MTRRRQLIVAGLMALCGVILLLAGDGLALLAFGLAAYLLITVEDA